MRSGPRSTGVAVADLRAGMVTGQGGGLWLRMTLPTGLVTYLAGAVGINGQFPAQLVQQDMVMPMAPVLKP